MLDIPTPKDLGLPDKYVKFRPNQPQAIEDGLNSPSRFTIQHQEPGSGKSLVYMSQALIMSCRTMILTSTKSLQKQLLDDFESIGLVDIRGTFTYFCEAYPGHTCDDGLVTKCPYKGSTVCPYSYARSEATTRQLVTSNYACWIANTKTPQGGFGQFEMLVLDEGHNAAKELASQLQISISEHDLALTKSDWPKGNREDMTVWKRWAAVQGVIVQSRIEELLPKIQSGNGNGKKAPSEAIKRYKHLRQHATKLAELANCKPDKWVEDEWNHGYQFDPIDVSEYAEKYLFHDIPKIIITSGTITKRSPLALGLTEDDFEYYSYPGNTDVSRTPLIYIPTVKVWRHSAEWELKRLVRRIDEIFELRADRKGIIHTVSHKLRDFIMTHSQYSRYFVSNYAKQGDLTSEVVNWFKKMQAPACLVSASVTQGVDFPHNLCRYQIIAKLPWPDSRSKVEQARIALDKRREAQICMDALVQMFARADRAEDDWQECFILDDSVEKFLWYNRDLAPPKLMACYRKMTSLPFPPEVN